MSRLRGLDCSAGTYFLATGWYALGHYLGERRLREWISAHGRWLAISARDLDRMKEWFRQHGAAVVFFGRLVPGVRVLISIPAGLSSMPLGPFLAFSAVGTALWTIALGYVGYVLGEHYQRAHDLMGLATWIGLGGVVLLYVVRVVRWERSES